MTPFCHPLYVFEHAEASDIRIMFGQWRGSAIDVTLEGRANVYYDEVYGAAVPIRVECPIKFDGIDVLDRPEASARSRLAEFYDLAPFDVQPAHIGFNFRLRE